MKRQILISIFTIVIASSTVSAQHYKSNISRVSYKEINQRKEIRELRKFEHQLDQFSYMIMVGNLWEAKKSKTIILNLMDKEIAQTERKLNALLRRDGFIGNSYQRKKNRRSNAYSKRNGYNYQYNKELNALIHRLEKQESLMYKFEETRLRGGSRRIANKNQHRKLMYKFRDTMKKEITMARDRTRRYG